jgi:hypothetical protein
MNNQIANILDPRQAKRWTAENKTAMLDSWRGLGNLQGTLI